jgi:FkbM family methyltransferase
LTRIFHVIRAKAQRGLSPRAFYLLRRAYLLARYYFGLTYDPDYAYVRHLPRGCTIIDIGANAGQSALEFARLRPDADIVSFEANRDNLADLAVVRRVLGQRFAFHHVALSDRSGNERLYVPVVGKTPVPGEASIEPGMLAEVERRVGKISKVLDYPVSLQTLDSYSLAPHFVKIDVQGHELRVLRGMRRTLELHRPVLMIEYGSSIDDVRRFLKDVGYGLFIYDVSADHMVKCDEPNVTNFFALPTAADGS